MIGVLIAQGLLRPDEEPFARTMIATHGMDTFAAFIAHRQLQQGHASTAVRAEMNRLLGVSPETFAKYNR
jgi:anthranilate/para-aminobenzoate synthase component I